MVEKRIHFQTIDVKFPKKLWIIAVWLVAYDGTELLTCLSKVNKNKILAIKEAEDSIKEIKAKFKPSSVLNHFIMIPLTFSKLSPLKKSYWNQAVIKITNVDARVSFTKAVVNPDYYSFLITPTRFRKTGKVLLTAAFAFKKGDEEILGELMKASDHPVYPEAKNAAIYEIGEAVSYDLVKKKEYVNEKYLRN
jgi:hypothetical protein